jgi:hypothetical protein
MASRGPAQGPLKASDFRWVEVEGIGAFFLGARDTARGEQCGRLGWGSGTGSSAAGKANQRRGPG